MPPSIKFVTLIAGLVAFAAVMCAQTIEKPPATDRSSLEAALGEAREALQHYQKTLASLKDLPEMDATVRQDSQLALSGRNATIWLTTKADLEGAVDTTEFAGLVDSIAACAAHAARNSSTLATAEETTASKRKLNAATALKSNAEELRIAADRLRQALKPYLQSKKPVPMV